VGNLDPASNYGLALWYWLAPWSRVLLENITDPQPFKTFSAFYGNRRFIAVLTTARHLFLFLASSIQSTPSSYVCNIYFNVILLSTSKPSKWSLSFKINHQSCACTSPLPHTCHMPRPSLSSWLDHPHNIWWGVQFMKLLIMQSFLFRCYVVRLRSKYRPLHLVFKHLQSTFLPQCGRPI
jgi:hypothetical protein